jgi:hypothetical protein
LVDQFNTDGRHTFLEKTPRHVFYYSKILKYYPDAKIICMVREPKNVISSQLTSSYKQNKSITRLSLLYNKITTAILKINAHDNVLLVKYEDLTDQTDLTLRKICKFLNIMYNAILIENVAAPSGIMSPHEFWKNKNIHQQEVQKNKKEKWRKTLSLNQANTINFITQFNAGKLGYCFSYKWHKVLKGFRQDIKRLITKSELRKIASSIHG